MSLSETQRAILTTAAQYPERLAVPPERLPAGARQKVAQVLLRQNLAAAAQIPSADPGAFWTIDGAGVLLQVTDTALRAIGIEPAAPAGEDKKTASESTAQDAPTAPPCGPQPAPQGAGRPPSI